MVIQPSKNEALTFKWDEETLKKILELKNISENITIKGTWEKGFTAGELKSFPCVINSISPLAGKLSEIYKYNISGEASYYYREYDWESKFKYDEDALYSPSMKVSYFDTNIEKIDIDTLKKYYERKFERRRL